MVGKIALGVLAGILAAALVIYLLVSFVNRNDASDDAQACIEGNMDRAMSGQAPLDC